MNTSDVILIKINSNHYTLPAFGKSMEEEIKLEIEILKTIRLITATQNNAEMIVFNPRNYFLHKHIQPLNTKEDYKAFIINNIEIFNPQQLKTHQIISRVEYTPITSLEHIYTYTRRQLREHLHCYSQQNANTLSFILIRHN